jgi:hypothetical protein
VLVREGHRGNIRAVKEIVDRVEGKAIALNELVELEKRPSIAFFDLMLANHRERKREKEEWERALLAGGSTPKLPG